MILSTFSDEQVLFELLEDYNSLRNKFKKTALKILKSYSDRGLCVNRNFSKVYKAVSANKNSWTVTLFFDKGNKSKWMMRACCEAESEQHNTKDYYVIRRYSGENPYFIKFSTHALKRVKERIEGLDSSSSLPEICNMIFHVHECWISMKYCDLDKYELIKSMDNPTELEGLQDVIITHFGLFFGNTLAGGNVKIKTYINGNMATSHYTENPEHLQDIDKESLYTFMGLMFHQYYNMHLYSADEIYNGVHQYVEEGASFDEEANPGIVVLRP